MSWVETFKRAGDADSGQRPKDDKLGPGAYNAKIVHAKEVTTRAGNPRFLFTFWTEQGVAWHGVNVPYEGCHRVVPMFFKRDMTALRITPEMLDADVGNALKSTVGQVWFIEIVEKGEYLNTELIEELDPRSAKLGPTAPPSKPEPAEPLTAEQREQEPFGDVSPPWKQPEEAY